MGKKQNGSFELSFNPFFKVDSHSSRVTSDRCLILLSELDERRGTLVQAGNHDNRT